MMHPRAYFRAFKITLETIVEPLTKRLNDPSLSKDLKMETFQNLEKIKAIIEACDSYLQKSSEETFSFESIEDWTNEMAETFEEVLSEKTAIDEREEIVLHRISALLPFSQTKQSSPSTFWVSGEDQLLAIESLIRVVKNDSEDK